MNEKIQMNGVDASESGAYIVTENNREMIRAYNQAGYDCTDVDLEQVLEWASTKRPELYSLYVTDDMMLGKRKV